MYYDGLTEWKYALIAITCPKPNVKKTILKKKKYYKIMNKSSLYGASEQ